jgi:uncharacterized membrane protein YeaQ/YmgE (transglycosylase-associated protein family)
MWSSRVAYIFPTTALGIGLLGAVIAQLIHRDGRAFNTDLIASTVGSFYFAMTARDLGFGYHDAVSNFAIALVACAAGSAVALFIVHTVRSVLRGVARLVRPPREHTARGSYRAEGDWRDEATHGQADIAGEKMQVRRTRRSGAKDMRRKLRG